MKYTAEVTIHEDIANIEKLFASEEKEFANERAKYEIVKGKNALTFKFTATDSTALRAVLNSVAKMLAVYEKTKNALKNR
jgi:tRNA threonylcarbamoyladenosine modification (KEOPS) complex  Pcc1 subunit